jgi:hypothetical protein
VEARIAGAFYLIVIVAGVFHYGFIRSAMVVAGDANATAANILKHELLYRLGFVAPIIMLCCNVPLALIFYNLFKAVNRTGAALVVVFTLVASAIETANLLNFFAPLIVLSGYRNAFTTEQLNSLAYMFLDLQTIGFDVAVVFFSLYDLAIGYLIVRSTFLPQALGFLMAFSGLCYLTNSFATFLAPSFAAHLVPYIQLPSGIAELSLCLWLLVFGVNEPRWQKHVSAAQQVAAQAGG